MILWTVLSATEPDLIAPMLGIVGLAGAAGVVWAVFRVKGTQATIDLLEQSLRIERTERQEAARRWGEERAHLEGINTVLTREFAKVIADAVSKDL